jgi:uncharacterized protein YheU (UPF0270 family)
VDSLRSQLRRAELRIVYDTESEHWDLLPRDRARELLEE